MIQGLLESLHSLKKEAEKAVLGAGSEKALEIVRISYLGKKGKISEILKKVGSLSQDQRPLLGQEANKVKGILEDIIAGRTAELLGISRRERLEAERLDLTLPGKRVLKGSLHPVTLVLEEIKAALIPLGFSVVEGPDIETDYYNFEALNIPKNHPARDMQDTFYISECGVRDAEFRHNEAPTPADSDLLLRTHTSPVQIRTMERYSPPMRIIAPGTVYRCDSDITHTPMFHQVEGFFVDKDVSFAQLKGLLTIFVHRIFGDNVGLRFRPSFFPFTEPSAEVDIECIICCGDGCRVCKGTGWLEILGAGMIDPEVFKAVGYDPEKYTGFAFGMGVERIAMLKYGIKDLRMFFENDIRFLEQF